MICIRDLSVTLGGRRILEGVDLDVAAGEAVALVGANGAGKTTVLRCLTGLVRYEGYVGVGDVDLARDPIGVKRQLGYMPQVPAFGEDGVRAALCFVAALRGVPRREVDQRLAQVGLTSHARRPVRQLSTGMRQRLSLAAALLGDPAVLMLDEPTASLDLPSQADLVALLRELQASGQTLLLSSHRAEEINALAHRVVVLDQGRVIDSGPVHAVVGSTWRGRPRIYAVPRPGRNEVAR